MHGDTAADQHVSLTDEALAGMTAEIRALYEAFPAWATGAYAIAAPRRNERVTAHSHADHLCVIAAGGRVVGDERAQGLDRRRTRLAQVVVADEPVDEVERAPVDRSGRRHAEVGEAFRPPALLRRMVRATVPMASSITSRLPSMKEGEALVEGKNEHQEPWLRVVLLDRDAPSLEPLADKLEEAGIENETAVRVGIVSSLVLPSEALWRRASFDMQSAMVAAAGFSPFSGPSVPSPLMILYGAAYALLALLLAMRQFARRDI